MKRFTLGLVLMISLVLSAGIPAHLEYHGPTEQLIKRESWERIESKLKRMKIPMELIPYFDSIAALENWGHIGYHGTNQRYRVYQDIIRFTIEEMMAIPIREDFHFLRVPGDKDLNLQTTDEFFRYWGKKIDNKNEIRAKQLLALNFSIYSNFDVEGSCSLSLFVNDTSKTDINYALKLFPYFYDLGLSYQAISDLFEIGAKWLDQDAGILLQISENSYDNFVDLICYPSKKGGVIHGSKPISDHYQRILSDSYVDSDVDIAPQLRLIMSNHYTLNPYTPLTIRRWDLYDAATIAAYELEMREYIRNLKYDKQKIAEYKDKLQKTWNQQ